MRLQEEHLYKFGPFALDAPRRVLMREGETVPVAPKAVDLLVVLAKNSGRVLSKDELIGLLTSRNPIPKRRFSEAKE